MTYTGSIHVDAPVEAVFDFLTDPGSWQEPALEAAEIVFKDARLTQEGPPLQRLLDLVTARTHGPRLAEIKARIEGSGAAA